MSVPRLSVIRAPEADPTDSHHLNGNDRCMFSNMYGARLQRFRNVTPREETRPVYITELKSECVIKKHN